LLFFFAALALPLFEIEIRQHQEINKMSKWWGIAFTFLGTLIVGGATLQVGIAQTTSAEPRDQEASLRGDWRIVLILAGVQKNLIFHSEPKGLGSFVLLDSRPEQKPSVTSLPAVWSLNSNNRVSFTGEAELPLGTCCVERGTVVFKGTFASKDSITGKVVFVTGIDEEESPFKLRSVIGTFTALRKVDKQQLTSSQSGPGHK
jgi:hypothetical protein